ncbi:MAG: glycosyltransferase family 2 protein [Thermoleophilaceae bacterium]
MSTPAARVVIRAKDEAASIGRVLEILGTQTVARELEVVVVDSGSSDATVDIARSAGARVIEIPANTFTFGGALNTGLEGIEAPAGIALSAHSFPHDERWAERMLEALEDESVACACGYDSAPDGSALTERLVQDRELAREFPLYGYSNNAGALRSELWRERGFRADMPGTEDKEWAWHWLERGRRTIVDPALAVEHDHEHEPPLYHLKRARREWCGLGMFLDLPAPSATELAHSWWRDTAPYRSRTRARVSPKRAAKLGGWYLGLRDAQRLCA